MIVSVEIKAVEPLADGAPFGSVGAYERVIGVAKGEVDPKAAGNRGIALIDKAPLNARGMVEYATDFFVLRPRDPAKGNGFPMRRGWTIVWSGWDPDAPRANGGLGLTAPVATDNGKPIVKIVREEYCSGTRGGALEAFKLSYEATSLDPAKARLTVRARADDKPQDVPTDQWSFVDGRSIKLLEKPKPGFLYDFHYEARNPKVQALGFAATRDLVSWLRHDPKAVEVTGRPISHVLAIGFSQGGRYLRHHVSEGFNRDEQGRRVFDGIHSHTAGIGRVFYNTPFAQPARTGTQHEDHDFPENEFPFSTATQSDPLTGQKGALFRGDGCDPLLIETNTSTEYWQKGASLLATDPLGQKDVALPDNSRLYMIAGTQHGGRAGAPSDLGPDVNPRNPHSPMPAVRALLVALDEWVASGKPPPPSRRPTLADGTLVEPDKTGFPTLPGAAIVRTTNKVAPPGDWVKPAPPKQFYRTLVCKVDSDGNEVAGIKLPDIAVPLATYTGWNEYKVPYPAGEMADRDGSYLAFSPAKIAERYKNRADYAAKVQAVVDQLTKDRLLLQEDAEHYLAKARAETRVTP